MAFEQTQQTRVESKQFTGDWAGFIAPQGNGGQATQPYYNVGEAIDFGDIAEGINGVVDEFERQDKEEAKRAGRGGSGSEDDSGLALDEAYDIVELNTNEMGELSARGQEQMRQWRNKWSPSLSSAKMTSILNSVGQEHTQTLQGMMEIQRRKHAVDQDTVLAKKGLELNPSMTGATQEEQAAVGRHYYKQYNAVSASFQSFLNPNVPDTVKNASIQEITKRLPTLIPEEMRNRLFYGDVTAQDELDVSNALTQTILASGVVNNVTTARTMANELSAEIVGQARDHRANLEKLSLEEKKRYTEGLQEDARIGLFNADPQTAYKAALTNYDFTKMGATGIKFMDENFDLSKFAGDGNTRHWQGAYDARTASFACQNGTELTCDAGFQGMQEQAIKRGDADAATQVINAMMNPNAKNYLNKPGMAHQREEAVARNKEQYAGLMVNELRPHIKESTGYMPTSGKAIDVGFFDTASKINPIMDKWKNAMRNIGMTDEEIVETGKNAMKALGVEVPDNTTNPEAFYKESAQKINYHRLMSPTSAKYDQTNPAYIADKAIEEYRKGDISAEEAMARMANAMKNAGAQGATEGVVNLDQDYEEPEMIDTEEGSVNIQNIEAEVLASPEFKEAMSVLEQDQTMQPEQKAEAANNTFKRLVDAAARVASEFGIKSANAGFRQAVPQNKIVDIAVKNAMPIEKYVGKAYNDGQLYKDGASVDWDKDGNVTIGYGINLSTNPLSREELDYFTINGEPLTEEQKDFYANKTFSTKDGASVELEISEPNAKKLFKERFSRAASVAKAVYEKATKGHRVTKFEDLSDNIKFVIADIVFNAGRGNAETRTFTMKDLGTNAITKALNGMKKLGLAGNSRIAMYKKLLLVDKKKKTKKV